MWLNHIDVSVDGVYNRHSTFVIELSQAKARTNRLYQLIQSIKDLVSLKRKEN